MDRMDPYQREGQQGSDVGSQLANLGQTLITYLRTRQPEHWLFLAIGVIIGLWLG
ncbi:MAG TPA: hypothetical protein VFZ01_04445 [Geminicoccaceae bacterium]